MVGFRGLFADFTFELRQRIMKLLARKKIVDALVERMVLANENLAFPPYSLPRGRVLQVVSDFLEAGLDVLVPGAVVTLAQHRREAGRSMSKVESASEDHHPGAIGGVSAGVLRAVGVDPQRDFRAGADRCKFFPMNRPRTPIERLAPFFPALAPHFEVVLLRDLEQKLRARRIVAGANETDVRMKKLVRADGIDIAIRRGRKELRRKAECSPFRVEPLHEN